MNPYALMLASLYAIAIHTLGIYVGWLITRGDNP